MEFNASFDIRKAFEAAAAEKVSIEVHLKGGNSIAASAVGSVGDHFVVLSRLTGKEFYDAVVRLDDVSAIVARVRTR